MRGEWCKFSCDCASAARLFSVALRIQPRCEALRRGSEFALQRACHDGMPDAFADDAA
jgi:hypothetical protein